MRRLRLALAPAALLSVGLVFVDVSPAFAARGTVTEFPSLGYYTAPWGLVQGPDHKMWFAEDVGESVGNITTTGVVTTYFVPYGSPFSFEEQNITVGPDGNLWFTVIGGVGRIGKITPAGAITLYDLPTTYGNPYAIAAGPDGNVWFTMDANKIVNMNPTTGAFTEYLIPTSQSIPNGIVAGPDGNMWFTESNTNKIGRLDLGAKLGTITEFKIKTKNSAPSGITVGPDGNLWFAEFNSGSIGRITTKGSMKEFLVPSGPTAGSFDITTGPDGALWFGENAANNIGRITVAGHVTEYPLPAQSRGSDGGPIGIATGPDGNVWFCDAGANKIGFITVS